MPATVDDAEDPNDPKALLPDDSVLSFEEYMEMQRAIGEPTRFRVLHYLKNTEEASPSALKDDLDIPGNSLHHHLNTLIEVGLVEKRARNEADSAGLFTYYSPTGFGEAILDHGVAELLRAEWEFPEMYRDDE